jgi:hypothetical protein
MSHHPEIQEAIDTAPSILEPWGMMHILGACNRIADERDEAVRLLKTLASSASSHLGGGGILLPLPAALASAQEFIKQLPQNHSQEKP